MNEENPRLLRLQEALRSLEHAARAARKSRGLRWSRRAAAQEARKHYGASRLDDRRIGEWLGKSGKPGRAPRDPDQVWALVRTWSAWAGEGPGRQDRRYWDDLVALAQPLPKSPVRRDAGGEAPGGEVIASAPSARRLWLPLENGIFHFLRDSEAARMTLVSGLLDAMISAYGERTMRFTLTLRVHGAAQTESTVSYYDVWCHQREFLALADRRHREWMTRVIDARLQATDVEATREALRRELDEARRPAVDWQLELHALFLDKPVPHTVTYEPSIRRLRFEAGPIRGTDPETHEDKVTTTSEALSLVCHVAAARLAYLGDPVQWAKNDSLVKLGKYMLDKKGIDFARFRVAQDDPETWDFRYP
ncbi:hypothetical protein [Amycolatopsis lexingtonensis]|uniref:hypothetical protein n=1 Tax=Amycolatopsis lexingtonensis TaxID=218822 RepID=UPI003F6ED0A5